MRFTLATILAVIPLLTIAAPYPHGTNIPLTKRSNLTKSDGSVDLAALKRHLEITTACVYPFSSLHCSPSDFVYTAN